MRLVILIGLVALLVLSGCSMPEARMATHDMVSIQSLVKSTCEEIYLNYYECITKSRSSDEFCNTKYLPLYYDKCGG